MRFFMLLAVACAFAGSWISVAAAQSAEQLPGEILLADSDAGDALQFQFDCNPDGSGTVTYNVSGRAIPQYTSLDGAFVEQGSFTFDSSGHVAAFEASFTITGSDGTVVTGSKSLDTRPDAAIGMGTCSADASGACSVKTQGASFTYESAEAGVVERGTGVVYDVAVRQAQCGDATTGTFEEDFLATDVAPPQATTLTLSPSAAVNALDQPHTVTATLTDQYGSPVGDYSILFTLTGAETGNGGCVTDVLGQCIFTFTSPIFPGVVAISACADAYGDGVCESDSPTATATKTYVLPTSTPGKATGDGRVGATSFSFSAKSDANSFSGTCKVVSATFTAKCLDVVAYVQTGNSASFYGNAIVNGVQTLYRIRVVDLSKTGTGDSFVFTTANGYSAGGVITQGNIKLG